MSPTRPAAEALAVRSLLAVLALTVANLLFNAFAAGHGWPIAYATFLPGPADLFGDFFKFVLSYPGGSAVRSSPMFGLGDLIARYAVSTDYHGLDGLGKPVAEHLHVTPLSTLASLLCLRAMAVVDPVPLFAALLAGLLAYWCRLAASFARSRAEAIAWVVLGLLAYPTLCMIDRANLFAGITALLVIHALMLGLHRRAPVAAALLLAVAVNVRPNAILLAVPLVAFYAGNRPRFIVALGLAGAAVFAASLAASTALYPAYRLETFLAGLRTYYQFYVIGPAGLAYGSSLFGAAKIAFGVRPGLDAACTAVAGAILASGTIGWAARRIDDATLLFLACAAYTLGSSVLADYHLIVFLIVPLAIARAAATGRTRLPHVAALTAGLLVLAPKNYVFAGDVSAQVVLNPVLLLVTATALLGMAWGRVRAAPGADGPAIAAAAPPHPVPRG